MKSNLNELLALVGTAMQKLTQACSMHLGVDCMMQASLAAAILAEHGYQARFVAGSAAWRVGSGPEDVLSHLFDGRIEVTRKGVSMLCHAWVEVEDYLFDTTTHSLPQKVESLNQMDGGNTVCQWNPPYLLISQADISSWDDIVGLRTPGLSHYDEVPQLGNHLRKMGVVQDLDPVDLGMLRMIMKAPNAQVFGPANTMAKPLPA